MIDKFEYSRLTKQIITMKLIFLLLFPTLAFAQIKLETVSLLSGKVKILDLINYLQCQTKCGHLNIKNGRDQF